MNRVVSIPFSGTSFVQRILNGSASSSFLIRNSEEWRRNSTHFIFRYKSSHIKIANRKKVEMFIGQRFHIPTRLRTAAPDIAAEWDSHKNPGHLYPEVVGVGCMDPMWWICQHCQHSFCMSPEKRVVRGGGCPNCRLMAIKGVTQVQNPEKNCDEILDEQEGNLRQPGFLSSQTSEVFPTSSCLTLTSKKNLSGGPEDERTGYLEEEEAIDLLLGEKSTSLRVKRPLTLTIRTKY